MQSLKASLKYPTQVEKVSRILAWKFESAAAQASFHLENNSGQQSWRWSTLTFLSRILIKERQSLNSKWSLGIVFTHGSICRCFSDSGNKKTFLVLILE